MSIVKILEISLYLLLLLIAEGWTKASECDIQKSYCEATIGAQTFRFDLNPKPVKAMQELKIEVSIIPPFKTEEILVDFTMPEMYMGENKTKLKRVTPEKFEGKIILPRCKKTLWQAELIDTSSNKSLAKFLFHIRNR